MQQILLIEDEPGLQITLQDRLQSEGYRVKTAGDGANGLEQGLAGSWDLIILDIMLPRRDGFEVCRTLRRQGIQTPILMLTARGQVVDKVLGLKLGADDYLTKPFEMMELLARVEALLRRTATQDPGSAVEVYRFGEVTINVRQAEVRRGGIPVQLSQQEYRLLKFFVEHPGTALSREALLNEVWGYHATPSTRTVDVHVSWLRQKLEPTPRHPRYILTVHGLGYRFTPEPSNKAVSVDSARW